MSDTLTRVWRGLVKTTGALAIAAVGLLYSGDAVSETAGQDAGCDRYAAKVQFKRHGPSPGFMKRTSTYIKSDLKARRPARNLEGRLSKFHPVIFRHTEYPGMIEGVLEKIKEFDVPLIEMYAFSRKVRHPEESQILAKTRAQFLELGIGIGLKIHNDRNPDDEIETPIMRPYKVGSTTRFGEEGANDIGLIIIRQYTGLEPVDFNSDTTLSEAVQKMTPMRLLCVDRAPEKRSPVEHVQDTPEVEESIPEETAPVQDGGFRRENPFGDEESVQGFMDRVAKLDAVRISIRDKAYNVFVVPYEGIKAQCSDRIDNDGDGLADYTGVSRAKGGPFDPDPDCTSARDPAEGPRACEGVVEALHYIAGHLAGIDDPTIQAGVCKAYIFLAQSQTSAKCVTRYDNLRAEITELGKQGTALRSDIQTYCKAHDCGTLTDTLNEFESKARELFQKTRMAEASAVRTRVNLQELCTGISI